MLYFEYPKRERESIMGNLIVTREQEKLIEKVRKYEGEPSGKVVVEVIQSNCAEAIYWLTFKSKSNYDLLIDAMIETGSVKWISQLAWANKNLSMEQFNKLQDALCALAVKGQTSHKILAENLFNLANNNIRPANIKQIAEAWAHLNLSKTNAEAFLDWVDSTEHIKLSREERSSAVNAMLDQICETAKQTGFINPLLGAQKFCRKKGMDKQSAKIDCLIKEIKEENQKEAGTTV